MKKVSLLVLIIGLLVFMSGCSHLGKNGRSTTDNQQATNSSTSLSKVAAPFQSIAEELLKTGGFPVFLPEYLPSLEQGSEWLLIPEMKTGTFTIEVDQQMSGATLGTYIGTISGNIGQLPEQPLVKQFENNNIGVNVISLPNGIKGQEYLLEGYPNVVGSNAVTWETGQWSYFVAASPGEDSGSTIDYARQIINTIENSGQVLPDSNGKLYFFYIGNKPLTEIYWEVNDAVWYQLSWQGNLNDAIKILQSMVYVGDSDAK